MKYRVKIDTPWMAKGFTVETNSIGTTLYHTLFDYAPNAFPDLFELVPEESDGVKQYQEEELERIILRLNEYGQKTAKDIAKALLERGVIDRGKL